MSDADNEKGRSLDSTENVKQSSIQVGYDEGWEAWSTALGVMLLQFSTYGYTNAHGVYTDFYVREYLPSYSSSQISWIGGAQFALSFLIGPVTGPMFDAGYFRTMCYGGSLLFSFSLFMLSLAQPNQFYQILLTQGIGLGLSIGLTYIPGIGLISHHFSRHRALAMGIGASGSALGGLIHPIVLNRLLRTGLGFQGAVKVSAGLCTASMGVACLMMYPRYPNGFIKKGFSVETWRGNVVRYFREPAFLFSSLGTCVALLGLYFPNFFLQLNAIKRGIDPNFAFYTISILNASNIPGRILPNLLVPRYGPFNAMILITFSCAVLIFGLYGVEDIGGTVGFAVLFGFFSGAYVGVVAPMVSSLAKDTSEIGSRVGTSLCLASISALTGSPIAGALLGDDFNWSPPILFSGATVALAAASFGMSRFFVARERGTWRV